MVVHKGHYIMRNGQEAYVWKWEAMPNADHTGHWVGTVRGGGITSWKEDGKDCEGYSPWDLVKEEENV